jgi:hypothetical protein
MKEIRARSRSRSPSPLLVHETPFSFLLILLLLILLLVHLLVHLLLLISSPSFSIHGSKRLFH